MTDDLADLVDELRALLRPGESPWLDAHEVAQRLRLKVKTVHNMSGPTAENPIPFHRLNTGGEKRFHVDEVDEWLRGR